MRRLITVRASPIHRKPTGSAKRVSSSIAAEPKMSAYSAERTIAPCTPPARPMPSSSLTRRVTAKRIPLIAKVLASSSTLMTSWYRPIPAAPMRPER